MGESVHDRCAMLDQIGGFDPHPESLPVNLLMRMPGTPLADAPDLDPIELVRTIAAARIVTPRARVRLSAGRTELTPEEQARARRLRLVCATHRRPDLRPAARCVKVRDTLAGWKFSPHVVDGRAVSVYTIVKFTFKLQ